MADFLDLNGGFTERKSTNASGQTRSRYTVTITAPPMLMNLEPSELGKGPAEAIADQLRERMLSIQATAAPATIKSRTYARAAMERGEAWALKRYAGGRLGPMLPGQTDNLFNDSGRFIKSIVARGTRDGTWVVNIAASRLNADTLDGGDAALQRIIALLKHHVPEFGDTRRMMDSIPVRRAIQEAALSVLDRRSAAAKAAIARQLIGFARMLA